MTHFTPEAPDFKFKSQNDLPKKNRGQTSVLQISTSQMRQTGWQNMNMYNTSSQRNIPVPHSIQTPAKSNIDRVQNDFPLQQAVSSKIVKPIPDVLYQRKNTDATVNSPV